MKKIDVYIIKKFLKTFLFTIALISVVSIAIDLSEKVTRLMKSEAPIYDVIFSYYLNFIPWIVGLLTPVFVLIAVIFFSARMAKNNEIIAILNAGVSYRRLMVPYMIGAGIIAAVLYIGGNYVIPISTAEKNSFENVYINRGNRKVDVDNVHFFLKEDEKAYVRYFRLRDTSMQGFRTERFNENGEIIELLQTDRLDYLGPPNKWRLNGHTVRKFDGLNESIQHFKEKVDTVFPFTPDDFVRYTNDMEMMTTPELKKFVAYEQSRGVADSVKHITEIQRRIADPFSIFILTILGVTVSSRKTRGGMGMNLAIGVTTGALFVFMQKFSTTFAQGDVFSPEIGMWIPNIFFAIVAIFFILRAQK
jgi:lipopolysaccharide export system permease protein